MPNDPIQQYIEASDNAADYADKLIEDLDQMAHEDIDYLLMSMESRDFDLWGELGVDPEVVLEEYEEVDPVARDLEWMIGFAGMSAASTTQFFLDNKDETIIKPVAYREQILAGFTLTQEQLILAGKRSVDTVSIAKFKDLRAEFMDALSFLREMDNMVLYNTLLEYDAIIPIDQQISAAQGYVSRLTNYKPNSPQFKSEVNKIIDTNSGRRLKEMNRRAVSHIYTFREADGDLNTLMVWIGEGGKNTCDYCAALFGEVKTWAEWMDHGEPGASICKGGDACRCTLAKA